MKINRKGFTLAEILITLAIVGLVTAFIIPQLITSVNKDKNALVLAKVVQQIEIGCGNLIQAYNANSSDGSIADRLSVLDGNYEFSFFNLCPYIGAEASTSTASSNTIYRFNNLPAEIKITGTNDSSYTHRNNPLMAIPNKTDFRGIVIDINGFGDNGKPNTEGRDQFVFDLDDSGHMIPHGTASTSCNGDNPTTIDKNCTARVVKDGYKINY